MFSFRRRSSSKKDQPTDVTPQLKSSPSLPKLPSQGIPWPESLVDVTSIRQEPPQSAEQPRKPGARKTSFTGVDRTPVSFHKPFRGSPGKSIDNDDGRGTISSLYMSHPPTSFEIWKASTLSPPANRPSQRRTRQPPTFNLMVVGGQGTGKTSFLRLLLETADISPTATADQRTAMDRFLNAGTRRTQNIQTACVEICESRFDRVLFSVIDTPGLDFSEGRELRQERQVSAIIKYLDTQYADTMSEESKVVRQSKGDQHIHLCVYMVDPSSIMTASARRAQSSMPTKTRTRSEATISLLPKSPDGAAAGNPNDSDDDSEELLTISPAEMRVIRRLSARANVLPIIARADSLTDDKLSAVKDAIRRDLKDAGLDFGVFGPAKAEAEAPKANGHTNGTAHESESTESSHDSELNGVEEVAEDSDAEDIPAERPSRPVIKLRPARHSVRLSRSRSRRDIKAAAEVEGASFRDVDRESVANVRFSAHIVAKTDLTTLLPFALITPESGIKRKHGRQRPVSTDSGHLSNYSSAVEEPSENGHGLTPLQTPISPSSLSNRNFAYLNGPPDDLKGVFTRKFRWGTVDVLDPNHCDFAALRTAVLSTHLKALKTRTREVLYEKYRTEKLLAWRATRNIDQEETKRMLEALEI